MRGSKCFECIRRECSSEDDEDDWIDHDDDDTQCACGAPGVAWIDYLQSWWCRHCTDEHFGG